MEETGPIEYLSLWWLFAVTIVVVLAALEGGYRLGRHRWRRSGAEQEAPVGVVAGATLALLAFVLAFTFGLAAERYDTRRELLQQEVNAIGTAYLRTSFVPEPTRAEMRALLREYVDARIEWRAPGRLEAAIRRSEDLHGRLWSHVEAIGTKSLDSELGSLFVQSLNEVIDVHGKRKTMTLWAHIPTTIWIALYLVAMVTMATVGYHAGVTGADRSLGGVALVFSFAVIMLLIADLDRPREGLLRLNPQALLDLRNGLDAHPH
jgi:hypothetical protein